MPFKPTHLLQILYLTLFLSLSVTIFYLIVRYRKLKQRRRPPPIPPRPIPLAPKDLGGQGPAELVAPEPEPVELCAGAIENASEDGAVEGGVREGIDDLPEYVGCVEMCSGGVVRAPLEVGEVGGR